MLTHTHTHMICMHEHKRTHRYFPLVSCLLFLISLSLSHAVSLFPSYSNHLQSHHPSAPCVTVFCCSKVLLQNLLQLKQVWICEMREGVEREREKERENVEDRWWKREQLRSDQGNDAANFGMGKKMYVSVCCQICLCRYFPHYLSVCTVCQSVSASVSK